jgi:carbon monoxide dehydrogenase subunit G
MPALRIVNLEAGLPDRNEAKTRLEQAIAQAAKDHVRALKIIHGYGSSGSGGILQRVIRSQLRQMKEAGRIRAFITGESWSQFDEFSKQLLKQVPETLVDKDLGRANRGITLVLM